MINPYSDLETEYSDMTRGRLPSGKTAIVSESEWGLYKQSATFDDSFDVEAEAEREEDALESQLALSGHLKTYIERRTKDTVKIQKDWRWMQYLAVQQIMTGESGISGKPLRGSKRTKAIRARPSSKALFENEAVHRVYSLCKEKKQGKGGGYTGFPMGSFQQFHAAYRVYKWNVKKTTQEPVL